MLLSLTNANPDHKGKIIVLNSECIVSIHQDVITRPSGTIEQVTFVNCPPHGTWEVSETPKFIIDAVKQQQ